MSEITKQTSVADIVRQCPEACRIFDPLIGMTGFIEVTALAW